MACDFVVLNFLEVMNGYEGLICIGLIYYSLILNLKDYCKGTRLENHSKIFGHTADHFNRFSKN